MWVKPVLEDTTSSNVLQCRSTLPDAAQPGLKGPLAEGLGAALSVCVCALQVKSSDEAVILCKTAIGALKLNIGDLQVTKVRGRLECLGGLRQ